MSELKQAIERETSRSVRSLEHLAGGDINDAYQVLLDDGSRLFVKTRKAPPPGMYVREAEGLAWLAEAKAIATPRVIAASEQLLLLDWIERAPQARDYDVQFGRGLAALHAYGAPRIGLEVDNYIGDLPQHNAARTTWAEFYRDCRLMPLVERAHARGRLFSEHRRAFEQLYRRLPELVGEPEPLARLHGDLWSGNVHVGPAGEPVLIDPSVYGGQRELDLAMLQLFGSPSPGFFAAYDEVWKRAPNYNERVALYQLYPLLVHVNLFAHGYVKLLESALANYA